MNDSVHAKPRLLVMTDISDTEPDDKESMVRLMTYSNEFDIEGLVACSSYWRTLRKNSIAPEKITAIVEAYAKVRGNLLKHAPGYPEADYLLECIKKGNANNMENVGDGKNSPGSQQTVRAIQKDDPRPLWITMWGGAATLAQALWDLRANTDADELDKLVSRIRVYEIAGQDDAGAWICHTFPAIVYIRSRTQFEGMSFRVKGDRPQSRGGNETVATPQWVRRNIQEGHGPLGEVYPDCNCIHEGDTPSYMYLFQNGLGDPEKPWYGSWGGRFSREPVKNPSCMVPETDETPFHDYLMYQDTSDRWSYEGRGYSNEVCGLFRWRTAFQNDFAARMDWCVKEYGQANHNPVAVVNGDRTKDILYLGAKAGEAVTLSGEGSHDPDGDAMTFLWWVYPEAGTYRGGVEIEGFALPNAVVHIPDDSVGAEIHVILTLTDTGEPPLCAYRRVVIRVE